MSVEIRKQTHRHASITKLVREPICPSHGSGDFPPIPPVVWTSYFEHNDENEGPNNTELLGVIERSKKIVLATSACWALVRTIELIIGDETLNNHNPNFANVMAISGVVFAGLVNSLGEYIETD